MRNTRTRSLVYHGNVQERWRQRTSDTQFVLTIRSSLCTDDLPRAEKHVLGISLVNLVFSAVRIVGVALKRHESWTCVSVCVKHSLSRARVEMVLLTACSAWCLLPLLHLHPSFFLALLSTLDIEGKWVWSCLRSVCEVHVREVRFVCVF